MFYWLLYEIIFKTYERTSESVFVKALNVFQYVTFRTAYATVTALFISWLFGGKVIEKLRALKFGQEIRAEGPESHQAKRGTPTMGGILIIGSVLLSTLLWARLSGPYKLYIWLTIAGTVLFAAVGFADDYIKIVKKRSLGLQGREKLLLQLLIALGIWLVLYFSHAYSWNVSVPFLKATADPNPATSVSYAGPFVYVAFIVVYLLGMTNAVNLTDGLDGLATGVTLIAVAALTGVTYVTGDARWAGYLDLTHRPEAAELTVFCGALVGASLGFLWYNAPPAEVFMGDVGSLGIGGAIGTVAVLTKQEFMMVIIGGVFIIEAASVAMQVSYFQFTKRSAGTGKRIFKMSPLHHHFEFTGWKETKIVFRFLILAILFALLGLSTLKLR
jgi:phospho-N-acetylmuramoyl-pentapeptide-transferase